MKVFGTGLQRTGTSSLAVALRLLGIRTLDFPRELHDDIDHEVASRFDGFTDNPIPALFRQLDARFPGSKFVHTVRDEPSWLASVQWLFTVGAQKFAWDRQPIVDQLHRELYGTSTFDEAVFLDVYRRHNREVVAHFAGRPDALLVLDVAAGDGFEQLCPFLGRAPLAQPFPCRNRRESRLRMSLAAWATTAVPGAPRPQLMVLRPNTIAVGLFVPADVLDRRRAMLRPVRSAC